MRRIIGVFVLLLAYGYQTQGQSKEEVTTIELSKTARGYQEEIRIGSDSIHVWIENNVSQKPPVKYSRKLEPEQWTRLINSFKTVKLPEIPVLPAPSMERAHDGAKHATITISTKGGKTYAHGYDDEHPHQALQPLLKVIRELEGVR